jgi:glycerophosphoryl diester phosphodiesterase
VVEIDKELAGSDVVCDHLPVGMPTVDEGAYASAGRGLYFGLHPNSAGKGSSMSNAIIKQQGDSPIVADNIWEIRLGAGSFILGVLAGTLVTAAIGRLVAKGTALPKPPTPRGWPINFAHRGGAKVVPENTIEGFREGFAMGGGVVECDVHASAEGIVVVIHDAPVDRTTDGTGPVAEKTVPELQSLDAAYRFTTDGGQTFPWRGKGVKIPTLEALYAAFPDAPFNIEIKGRRSGIEEAVFRQIVAAGAAKRTLVVSDNRGTISRFRKISQGRVATASSTIELLVYWLLHVLRLGSLHDPPFQALQAPEKYKDVVPVVTPRFVRKAHDRGLRVDVWTIDDEPAMRRLLSFGVDGIMTDRPDVLAGVLNNSAS